MHMGPGVCSGITAKKEPGVFTLGSLFWGQQMVQFFVTGSSKKPPERSVTTKVSRQPPGTSG